MSNSWILLAPSLRDALLQGRGDDQPLRQACDHVTWNLDERLPILPATDTSTLPRALEELGVGDVNERRSDFDGTVLHLAIAVGDLEACEAILVCDEFRGINEKDMKGRTALHIAACCGAPDVFVRLLRDPRFKEQEARDAYGLTAFEY